MTLSRYPRVGEHIRWPNGTAGVVTRRDSGHPKGIVWFTPTHVEGRAQLPQKETCFIAFFPGDGSHKPEWNKEVDIVRQVGSTAISPLNQEVIVIEVTPTGYRVRLAGPYAATVEYPSSTLRDVWRWCKCGHSSHQHRRQESGALGCTSSGCSCFDFEGGS